MQGVMVWLARNTRLYGFVECWSEESCLQAQAKLAKACGMANASELAAAHAAALLAAMLQRSTDWHHGHPDLPAFMSLLRVCPATTLAALGSPLLRSVGAITSSHERDAQLRISLLRAMDALLEAEEQGSCIGQEHGLLLLSDVLLPPLVWRAGMPL